MDKANWVWLPHAAHFICADKCRFHLATYVGGFIVSTVGEYLPDSAVREIMASSRGVVLKGRGDEREADWTRKVGWEEIGCGRTYETMVFAAERRTDSEPTCCPWEIESGRELDFEGYKDAVAATEGHMRMCEKWAAVDPATVIEQESVT